MSAPMQLFVQFCAADSDELPTCITVEPSEPIASVMEKVEAEAGVFKANQRLFSDHTFLHQDQTLADYSVQNGSTIRVLLITSSETDAAVYTNRHLLPTQVNLPRYSAVYVQAVDAIGTVPFSLRTNVMTFARPVVGELLLRDASGTFYPGAVPAARITVRLPDGSSKIVLFRSNTGKTEREVLSHFYTTIGAKVPERFKPHGFDLYITRPGSETQVQLDDAAVLVSPENATRTIHVRPVIAGATPAFNPIDNSSSDSDASDSSA